MIASTNLTRLTIRAKQELARLIVECMPHWTCAAVFTICLVAGWGKWANPIVDFGRELYVPWRLNAGDVLYRDIAYFNGPLSPYWNSLAFRLGGASLRSLTVANAIVVALLSGIIFHLARRGFSRRVAGLVVCTFFIAFAFAQHSQWGAYNYLAPYSHELTHGVLLGMFGLTCSLSHRHLGHAATGAVGGLLLLGKPETFLAYLLALIALRIWDWSSRGMVTRLAYGVIPLLVAIFYFISKLGWSRGLQSVFSGWYYLFTTDVGSLPFYRQLMGWHTPLAFMGEIVRAVVCLVALLVAIRSLLNQRGVRDWLALAVSFAMLFWLRGPGEYWLLDARVYLIVGLVVLSLAYHRRWTCRDVTTANQDRTRIQVVWATFGLFLMLKLGLRPTLHDYGFVLAMPLTLLGIGFLFHDLPNHLVRAEKRGQVIAVLALLLVVDLLAVAGTTWTLNKRKTLSVGIGVNRFNTYGAADWAVGVAINETLDILSDLPPESTVAAVPEGVMLNFLSGRRAPSKHINFMPPEFEMFGESAICNEFAARPPDILVVVDKDVDEYGVGPFGSDQFGKQFVRWIDNQYRPWKTVDGSHPTQPLSIKLMRQNTSPKRQRVDRE